MVDATAVAVRQLFGCAQRGDGVRVHALLAVVRPGERRTVVAANRALTAAVRNDHASAVAALVAHEPHMWTERFPQLLRVAARHGSFRVAAVLVAANASVNGANSGTSPLCIASRKGHVSCVSLLLAMKACTSAAGYQSSALQRAAVFGHADVAECLLRAKADLQQPNSLNETPVYLAAARKSGEPVLRVLLDAHADVNPPSPCKSPLCGAAGNVESPGVFQLLLGARADVSGVTTFGCTALSLAVHNMCPDTVVKLLLRAKADVNAADRGEFTALHYTATRGRCITARLLVRAKADVRAKTKLGDTAANLAWTYRNFDLADYFKAVAGLSKA